MRRFNQQGMVRGTLSMRTRRLACAAMLVLGSVSAFLPSHTSKTEAALLPNVTVTNVAVNVNSAKITFSPVAGAADYRIYDVSNPRLVKYAGLAAFNRTGVGSRFVTVNNDGVHPRYPLQLETIAGWGDTATTSGQEPFAVTGPLTTIEWNALEDHQPHTLIVQAVDQVGPQPADNAYTVDWTTDTIVPTHPTADTLLGANEGSTGDGNISINGQGPVTDTPQVIAQSAPFTVQANAALAPVPSSADATQTYLDTFANAEASSLRYVGSAPGIGSDNYITYTLNDGQPNAASILFEAADPTLSTPMIEHGHFMDILADSKPGASWATMALTPRTTPDISGGRMLHLTMEVDGLLDDPGRRWVGFDIAPADDPIQSHDQNQFGVTPPNRTGRAIFIGIGNPGMPGTIVTQEYTGTVSAAGGMNRMARIGTVARNSEQFKDMGLDNRERFDLYLTQDHYAIYEDGALAQEQTFPTPLDYSTLSVSYAHYYYHAAAEPSEEEKDGVPGPVNHLYAYDIPLTDERHWANLGAEVLPASDAPADWTGNLNGLAARSQPATGSADACPAGWSCDDLGAPFLAPSVQWTSGGAADPTWTIGAGGTAGSNADPNQGRFVSQAQTGDTTISARLLAHLHTHNGLAGVMIRGGLDGQAPFYAFGNETESVTTPWELYDHLWYRATAGGPVQDVKTTVASLDSGGARYVRVGRVGDTFTAYTSSDGATWTAVPGTTQTIVMGAGVRAGVADLEPGLTWLTPNLPGSATFDAVTLNGTPAPILAPASAPAAIATAPAMDTPMVDVATTTPEATDTMAPMAVATVTATPMPSAPTETATTSQPIATMTLVPSTGTPTILTPLAGSTGAVSSIVYDNSKGALGPGWVDCSHVSYEHLSMTGQGGTGAYTLHTLTKSGESICFDASASGGYPTDASTLLRLRVKADTGNTTPLSYRLTMTDTMGMSTTTKIKNTPTNRYLDVDVPFGRLAGMRIARMTLTGTEAATDSWPVSYIDGIAFVDHT